MIASKLCRDIRGGLLAWPWLDVLGGGDLKCWGRLEVPPLSFSQAFSRCVLVGLFFTYGMFQIDSGPHVGGWANASIHLPASQR
jgi:hypothetical protein